MRAGLVEVAYLIATLLIVVAASMGVWWALQGDLDRASWCGIAALLSASTFLLNEDEST